MSTMRKILVTVFGAMFLVCASLFAAACVDGDNDAAKYTVTTEFNSEQGTVTLSPAADGNKYAENAEVTVTVSAKSGYAVDAFTVSTDSAAALTNGKYTFKVTADTAIKATFRETLFTEEYIGTWRAGEGPQLNITADGMTVTNEEQSFEATVTKNANGTYTARVTMEESTMNLVIALTSDKCLLEITASYDDDDDESVNWFWCEEKLEALSVSFPALTGKTWLETGEYGITGAKLTVEADGTVNFSVSDADIPSHLLSADPDKGTFTALLSEMWGEGVYSATDKAFTFHITMYGEEMDVKFVLYEGPEFGGDTEIFLGGTWVSIEGGENYKFSVSDEGVVTFTQGEDNTPVDFEYVAVVETVTITTPPLNPDEEEETQTITTGYFYLYMNGDTYTPSLYGEDAALKLENSNSEHSSLIFIKEGLESIAVNSALDGEWVLDHDDPTFEGLKIADGKVIYGAKTLTVFAADNSEETSGHYSYSCTDGSVIYSLDCSIVSEGESTMTFGDWWGLTQYVPERLEETPAILYAEGATWFEAVGGAPDTSSEYFISFEQDGGVRYNAPGYNGASGVNGYLFFPDMGDNCWGLYLNDKTTLYIALNGNTITLYDGADFEKYLMLEGSVLTAPQQLYGTFTSAANEGKEIEIAAAGITYGGEAATLETVVPPADETAEDAAWVLTYTTAGGGGSLSFRIEAKLADGFAKFTLSAGLDTYEYTRKALQVTFEGGWVATWKDVTAKDDANADLVIGEHAVTLGGDAYDVIEHGEDMDGNELWRLYNGTKLCTMQWFGLLDGQIVSITVGEATAYYVKEFATSFDEKFVNTWYSETGPDTLVITATSATFNGREVTAFHVGDNVKYTDFMGASRTIEGAVYYLFVKTDESVEPQLLNWYKETFDSGDGHPVSYDNPQLGSAAYMTDIYVDEDLRATWTYKGQDLVFTESGVTLGGQKVEVYNNGHRLGTGNYVVLEGKTWTIGLDPSIENNTVAVLSEVLDDYMQTPASYYVVKKDAAAVKVTVQALLGTTWTRGETTLTFTAEGGVELDGTALPVVSCATSEWSDDYTIACVSEGKKTSFNYLTQHDVITAYAEDGYTQVRYMKQKAGGAVTGLLGIVVETYFDVSFYSTVTVTAENIVINSDSLGLSNVTLTMSDLTQTTSLPEGITGTTAYTFTAETIYETTATFVFVIDGQKDEFGTATAGKIIIQDLASEWTYAVFN